MLLTNRNKRLYSCFPFSRITEGPPKEIDILFCDSMGNIEKSIITSLMFKHWVYTIMVQFAYF